MGAIATHERSGELPPQAHVIETWAAVEHALDGLLQVDHHTKANKEELAATLTAHTDTIPRFIREYVGEDCTPEAMTEAHLLIAQLQQKPFALYAMVGNMGETGFHLTDWAASEGRTVEIMLRAMDRSQEEGCTETFEELVVMNIYTDLCGLLGNNINTLLTNAFPPALQATS